MRVSVPLRQASKLLNHGPTTLITAAANGRRNVMAAAWVMPLDFEPPKLAVVIAQDTFTRQLIEASGELVVQVPTKKLVDLTWTVGSTSGSEQDKFAAYGIETAAAAKVAAPLVAGCIAWLEAKVIPQPALATDFDLFLVEVVAAWADDRVWRNGAWHFTDDELRSLHHVSKGHFFLTGPEVQAKQL
ncbi:MAG: flavin reductase family protein [Myxococcota bacterium]